MSRRLAGVVDICGLPFRVFVADEIGYPKIQGLDGCCLSAAQEIYIRKGLAPAYAFLTLIHECFHGIWFHSGCAEIATSSKYARTEEAITLSMTPHIVVAYESAKKVRL